MSAYDPKTILDLVALASSTPTSDVFLLVHKNGEELATKMSLADLLVLAAAGGVPLLAKYDDLGVLATKDNTDSLLAYVPGHGIYEWIADASVVAGGYIGEPVDAGASAGKWCRIMRNHPGVIPALTEDTPVDWNMSVSPHATLTMTDDRTLNIANPVIGVWCTLRLIQDAPGGRALTLPAEVKYLGATWVPVTTANSQTLFEFFYDGTNYLTRTSIIV